MEVVLDTTLEYARQRISAEMATLEELAGGGILLRGYTYDPDWMARMLASLGCRLEIRRPQELRDALRRHAAEIALWAEEAASQREPDVVLPASNVKEASL